MALPGGIKSVEQLAVEGKRVFVRVDYNVPLDKKTKQITDDARIREWARRARIDPAKVRARHITLNHDGGRWLSLGLQGELPAVVRQVGGQWQRQ